MAAGRCGAAARAARRRGGARCDVKLSVAATSGD
jgi:hypothetical protein